jgi:hypothetical protein
VRDLSRYGSSYRQAQRMTSIDLRKAQVQPVFALGNTAGQKKWPADDADFDADKIQINLNLF